MYVSWEDALKRSFDNEPIRVQRRMFAGFPREKLSINEGMSIAMFDYQRVGVMVVMALASKHNLTWGNHLFRLNLGHSVQRIPSCLPALLTEAFKTSAMLCFAHRHHII